MPSILVVVYGNSNSPPSCDWFPLQLYTLFPPAIGSHSRYIFSSPPVIGSHSRYILSSPLRLVPTPGIYSLPSCDWPLPSPSPPGRAPRSAIGAKGYPSWGRRRPLCRRGRRRCRGPLSAPPRTLRTRSTPATKPITSGEGVYTWYIPGVKTDHIRGRGIYLVYTWGEDQSHQGKGYIPGIYLG